MIVPWVQVYSNLPQHDKVVSLADTLGLKCSGVSPEAIATGLLVSLWCWAVQNRTDGDLSGVNPRTIAKACQWEKSPDKLVSALRDCGWLDADMHIHDWEEYSVRLMENEAAQKEKTRKRVAEYRERHAKGGKAKSGNADENETAIYNKVSSNENVTVTRNVTVTEGNEADTQCNASTVPNLTVPNLTVQERKDRNKLDTLVAGVTPVTDDAPKERFLVGERLAEYQDRQAAALGITRSELVTLTSVLGYAEASLPELAERARATGRSIIAQARFEEENGNA